VRKIILLLLIVPFLSNCTQYTAMVGPSLTFAQTGSVLQASTSLSSSLAMNKLKNDYMEELSAEKICPTIHSSELNQIFFETIEHMDCFYDPMSILR
jgi:hypothetical protein|tara:strand:- start:154 stop:444 length:291 start_codon:yes stop_codon:yes gene_type:complete